MILRVEIIPFFLLSSGIFSGGAYQKYEGLGMESTRRITIHFEEFPSNPKQPGFHGW